MPTKETFRLLFREADDMVSAFVRSQLKRLFVPGVDEDVHLPTDEEWKVVFLDPLDDLQYARVHAFSAVTAQA